LNAFYYKQMSANNDATNNASLILLSAFVEDVLTPIANLMRSTVLFDEIEVINLFDEDDVSSDASISPAHGSLSSGEETASYLALEFTTSRVTRAIRRGFKRFWGFPEGWVTDGVYNGVGDPTPATAATAMSADIAFSSAPLGPTFRPVVVKRIKYTTEEGHDAYRLPANGAEAQSVRATWSFQRISTQNSRKPF
jgi:hypothetical protein